MLRERFIGVSVSFIAVATQWLRDRHGERLAQLGDEQFNNLLHGLIRAETAWLRMPKAEEESPKAEAVSPDSPESPDSEPAEVAGDAPGEAESDAPAELPFGMRPKDQYAIFIVGKEEITTNITEGEKDG